MNGLMTRWMLFKWWLLRHYIFAGVTIAVSLSILLDAWSWSEHAQITGVAALFSYVYFCQRQRLEETRLFKELFTEFNRRYDRLNDYLVTAQDGEPLGEPLQRKFVDYFNLCSEEYLFYRRGYIDPLVWRSWCKGMLQYLELQSVRRLWDREIGTDSYYTLTYDDIVQGAATKILASK